MHHSLCSKMKTLTVIILAVIAGVSGYLIKVPVAPILEPKLAPSGWVHLQKLVLPLFDNVCEASNNPVIVRLAQEFASSVISTDFWDPDVITKFQSLKASKSFLPKGEIFSEYNVEHINELKVMFDIMCSAKTFDAFYKVAAWSRQNLNCGLYVNLIYMAMENRRDSEKLTLPPPYELLPNYFIRKDIVIQGSSLLAGEEFTPSEGVRDEGNTYTLDANYTANFYDNDDESKLAYFREDIGLNSYYFLKMLKWTPWLNQKVDINSRYGEEMFHMIKQLVGRYNMERYANGMPEQDDLSWDYLSDAPYDPMLVYSNGNEFIHRTSPVQLPENEDKALLLTIENNIATVVSHMRDAGYNKTQILNHLMEILVTGERSYDTLARHLLGKALSNNGEPSVFEHYMTSLRDPMIWKMYKKIVCIVDDGLKMLPPYSKSELYFPGVEVINIDVKKMMTNFDYFEFDITEALKIGNGDTTFRVKIGQPRLNHKTFVMKLNISSLVTQRGLVKIYLGPKMMPGEFAKKKNLFNLLDSFEINLKRGSNIVSRTSSDMKTFAPDFISLKTLSKMVEDAQFGLDSLPLNTIDSQIGFPERLTIPKGTPEGLPLQLFVFVAPYMKMTAGGSYLTPNLEFNPAILSPLYPLDLTMEDKILLEIPNAMIKDVIVSHKGVDKVNNYGGSGATKSWSRGPSAGPNVYNNGYESFDYNTKKLNDDMSQVVDFSRSNAGPYYQTELMDSSVQNTKPYNLKTTNFDYTSRPKQPYVYQPKRPDYQKPDYSSKKVDYKAKYQNKATEYPLDTELINKQSDEKTINENQNSGNRQEDPVNEKFYNVYQESDTLNEDIQNDDSSLPVKRYLLRSSAVDSMSKPNDNVFKRPKLVKPDYKKMYKNIWKTTETPDIKNKMSKQWLLNEEQQDLSKADKQSKIFKIVKDNGNIQYFDIVSPSEDDYVRVDVIDEPSNDDTNADSLFVKPMNKYNTITFKDIRDANNGNYFEMYKNNINGEEFFSVVPVPESPKVVDDLIYNNLRQLMN